MTKSGIAASEIPATVIDLVGRPAVAERRDHAAEDRKRDAENECEQRELRRVADGGAEEIPRRHLPLAATSRGRPARAPRPSRGTGSSSGRFVPSCSFNASTDSWVAKGPRTERPTSPGRMFDTANTTTLSKNNVISASPRRLRTKRITGVRRRGGRWRGSTARASCSFRRGSSFAAPSPSARSPREHSPVPSSYPPSRS